MIGGLKVKLVVAFLSIIILPLVIGIGLLSFLSAQINKSDNRVEEALFQIIADVPADVLEHFHLLKEPSQFYKEIEPLLHKYDVNIQIEAGETIIFSSKDFQQEQVAGRFFSSEVELYSVKVEVGTNEQVNVHITTNPIGDGPFKNIQLMLFSMFASIGVGVVVLLLLVIGWTWYFAKTILQPIKQMYTATEEMRIGNLDYEISYQKNDEIGRFINGFNLMRNYLKESEKKQRELEKNKKELIASISHDLRTPLASIKGYVEGLQDGVAQEEEMRKKYLQVIKTKTEQLDRLIEDLFDYSKLELNELSMDMIVINGPLFFKNVINHMQLDVKQRNGELTYYENCPEVFITIDKYRLQQVMTNLIDNALRYGGTKIDVMIEEQKGRLLISIKDNGHGIRKEDVPFLFQRFFRGERSRSREHGGTGLGLAITKAIIESHHGDISVVSEVGVGSTFSFTLPITSN